MSLRESLSKDWLKFLEITVDALNSTATQRLGYLIPNSISSEIDSPKVQEAKNINKIKTFTEVDFRTQLKNQKEFDDSITKFNVNDYVYLDFNQKLFDKSFDVSVSLFYNILFNFQVHVKILTKPP